uniref:Secreted protein n=1 Tax=Cacopsylla melanoneura TaxID=428564 RepID=A0A8D8WHD8_9HEMI
MHQVWPFLKYLLCGILACVVVPDGGLVYPVAVQPQPKESGVLVRYQDLRPHILSLRPSQHHFEMQEMVQVFQHNRVCVQINAAMFDKYIDSCYIRSMVD